MKIKWLNKIIEFKFHDWHYAHIHFVMIVPHTMEFTKRDEFPTYLNQSGLVGSGAEIGVQSGCYSEILLSRWKGNGLFSIDAWQHFDDDIYVDIANLSTEQHLDLYANTSLKLRPFGDRSIIWRMTSHEASRIIPDKTLDFCYLDADHSYKGVLNDLKLWVPKIKNGGIICGHDYINDGTHYTKEGVLIGDFGVQKAVGKISNELNWKIHVTEFDEYPSWFATIADN